MRGLNDNVELAGRLFAPSIGPLLAPSAALVVIYGTLLTGLAFAGQIDSPVALLCTVTLAATPFLVAYAVLRRVTTRLAVLPHGIHAETGFPSGGAVEVPYGLIRSLDVRRGLAGRCTLVVRMANGHSVAVCDLADPEAAANAIYAQMTARAAAARVADNTENAGIRRVSAG